MKSVTLLSREEKGEEGEKGGSVWAPGEVQKTRKKIGLGRRKS